MSKFSHRTRRVIVVFFTTISIVGWLCLNSASYETEVEQVSSTPNNATAADGAGDTLSAMVILSKLEVRGRAPKTGYSRDQFYGAWPIIDGCSLRQRIIKREMGNSATLSSENDCDVISGEYDEPYTGSHMVFYQKSDFTTGVQIDHVVALSDAWQKGAQNLTKEQRYNLATDPLNLLAVDAATNMKKSDGDAATWLPPNKKFRCGYIARQISVKYKYGLWVSESEHDAMRKVLEACPNEPAVGVSI